MAEVKEATKAQKTVGYAVLEAKKPLEQWEYELGPPGYGEVLVSVKYTGVCYSDIDACSGKYGPMVKYPLVAGHEGCGVVASVGPGCRLKVGDNVGLGVYRDSCTICQFCADGMDNACVTRTLMFMNGAGHGTFGNYVLIKERYAFKLPEKLDITVAGPLMCAGVTVFAPFRKYNIIPGSTVAVVGVGGLGHLGIQIGAKWGCEVIAISGSSRKRELATKLGAHKFVDMSKEEEVKSVARSIDHILLTGSGDKLNWAAMFSMLKRNGQIICIGFSQKSIPISPAGLLVNGAISITSSAAGSNGDTRAMLRFCALHNIKPMVENYPISKINEVIEKIKSGKVTFRAVLEHGK